MKRLSYASGETIVLARVTGASMFVILGGSVSVTLPEIRGMWNSSPHWNRQFLRRDVPDDGGKRTHL